MRYECIKLVLVRVIHINLTYYQLHVALVLSILHNVCAGYMCFVKL